MTLSAINLQRWIDEHRDVLKPPVGNAQIWDDGELIVTIVAGPNERTDYHDDPCEEFFYQLKGNMVLRVWEDRGSHDVPINEGDVLRLPAHVLHSPQRPEPGSLGLVIELKRPAGEKDAFVWFCEKCSHQVQRSELQLESIVDDLPPVFKAYYEDPSARVCPNCGHQNPGKPGS